MPASIYTLLADRLDLSEQQAEQLLTALLQEVQKRAHREGVRLPDLGTFRSEEGHLTFEPVPSLSRAVNEEFEGMAPEPLPPTDEEDEAEDDGELSTITLGYQSTNWTPSDSSKPDTEEVSVPSSAQDSAEDHESSSPPSASNSTPDSDQEAAASSAEPPSASDDFEQKERERKQLSSIWDPDADAEATEPEPDPIVEEESDSFEVPDPPTPVSEDEPAERPTDEREMEQSEPSSPPPPSPSDESSSSPARLLVTGLFVLLLLGGGWFVLGRTGTLPAPSTVLSPAAQALQSRLASDDAASPPSPSSESTTSESNAASSQPDASDTGGPAPDRTDRPSQQEQSAASSGIDFSAGGWTIVVASRTSRSPAEDLRATYRDRFSGESPPVDILVGQAGGTTRYRVAVGQYGSREDARRALRTHQSNLPDGAWPLRLE